MCRARPTLPFIALALTGCSTVVEMFEPGVPNPYLGDDTLLLELRCDAASAAAASNLVGTRLALLDLRHSVTAHPSGQLSITTTNATQAHANSLAELLTASPDLGFHAVLEDQRILLPRHSNPEEAVLEAIPTPGTRPDLAFDVEAMQALMAQAGGSPPPVQDVRLVERYGEEEMWAAPAGADWQPWLDTLPLPEGAAVVSECWHEDREELCSPLLIEALAPVTAARIEHASLDMDEHYNEPHLALAFDESGREAFHKLSERLVGRFLAIVSGGRVLSKPRVMEPIPGGKAWLTLGYDQGDEDLLDLWGYYAVLETGPLPGDCQVQDSQAVP
jgi:hypothetical protein